MDFTTITSAIIGGVLIGFGAATLMLLNGRIAGISGIFHGIFKTSTPDRFWRVLFVAGLVAGGAVIGLVSPSRMPLEHTISGAGEWTLFALAGLLVGIGSRVGNGCASGHGVCGVGRLSIRSIIATATFTAAGVATMSISGLLS